GPTKEMSERAGWALMQIGDPAVPAVIAALRSPDDQVRKRAAGLLGCMRNAMAVPAINELLQEENLASVPRYAITALGKIGTSEPLCAIRVLIKKLIGRVEALEYNNITDLVPGWPDCLYTLNLIADSVHALTPIGFPAVPTLVEVVEWLI